MDIIEEKQQLEEMGRMIVSYDTDKLPFKVAIQSPDHDPPHAHVLDKKGKLEIGQFLVIAGTPRKPSDIKDYKQGITDEIRDAIFAWSSKPCRALPKATNWEQLVALVRINSNSCT
jgi:hypothetical protein